MIERPDGYWKRKGFVEMVPPIVLPTRTASDDFTAVWLYVPQGASIEIDQKDGSTLLRFPPGADAARVESLRNKGGTFFVADVRGTRFLNGGRELFYVYRPDSEHRGRLAGYAWPRGDSHRAAAARTGLFRHVSRNAAPGRRDDILRSFAHNTECARCHVHARPDNRRPFENGEVNRGTDASGLFLIQTVLASEAPLESYQPYNGALDSPYVTVHCTDGRASIVGKPARAVCANGEVPRARFNMQQALLAQDAHARRVCAARRYLLSHMRAETRAHFQAAQRECEF